MADQPDQYVCSEWGRRVGWLTRAIAGVSIDPSMAKFRDIEGLASESFGRGKRRKTAGKRTNTRCVGHVLTC